MKIGYSLLIDEYADANVLEQADCELLQICCPVCFEPVALVQCTHGPALRHATSFLFDEDVKCERRVPEFTPEYCEQHNARARKKRLEFLRWNLFVELLNKDPVVRYEKHAMMALSNLRSKGALIWLPEWHLEWILDTNRARLQDKVEFWTVGEKYLSQEEGQFPHVPKSEYARQVDFQIAYDWLQYLLSRQGLADDNYGWLFAHAFRVCLGSWIAAAKVGLDTEKRQEPMDEDATERTAATRILVSCCCDMISDVKRVVEKSIQTMNDVWMKPPITPSRMPFLIFFAAEVAGMMQTTLFRLPFLPLLEEYERPCRPRFD